MLLEMYMHQTNVNIGHPVGFLVEKLSWYSIKWQLRKMKKVQLFSFLKLFLENEQLSIKVITKILNRELFILCEKYKSTIHSENFRSHNLIVKFPKQIFSQPYSNFCEKLLNKRKTAFTLKKLQFQIETQKQKSSKLL